ncbi:tRNA (adenosine(37)-N6)-threonylcarbamoyltransferase complex dimerization subunit type 1 TsaB [Microbacterium schleiferi]|uniref:tRNA (Adenosine(37)-N6)-threonylcarbamoyltransferase complex dimerization subunit type 1 TsaB n=1 Tax=Microbacterium schleiferi TaxID=69362 RepID=A0A7S8MXH1_9MICO|nr:tRNA (adenosine(37)-N6)-threonylcarbamoyltransferase complex dimerization subunit type 1 TsaB [Microbacterium schleiferi]QPE05044.1 tRNA (adenosine(37)-N6)-threonylcarbamoyltransferase complex dimerization subunit type 1 TsaB [Microbacterium schleiferi]
MILGIDTSLGTAAAVVETDGVVLAEASSANPLGHAEVIGDLLQTVLGTARTDAPLGHAGAGTPGAPAEITAVAAGMGPGPFTGLRVGIAAARTFALGRGIPVVPVVSHDAAALGILLDEALAGETDADPERFAIVTDARRREFAYTVYEGMDDDGLPIRVAEPALSPRDDIDAVLTELDARRHDTTAISAAMVALVAARAVAAGREVGPRDALYLRSPDVTLSAGPKKVGT